MFSFNKDSQPGTETAKRPGFFQRLKQGLTRTRTSLTDGLARLVLGKKVIDDEVLEEIETHLLTADVGAVATQRILADLEESEHTVATEHATISGAIRVAAPLSFGIHHLSPVLNNFQQVHPEVSLELNLDDRQINLLEAGFDLGLRIGKLEDSSLIARRLAPIRRIVLASPAYLQKHGEPRSPEDLKQHTGLTYTNMREGQLWQFNRPDGSLVSVRVPGHLKANNGEYLLNAAIDGLGVVVSTTFIASNAIERGLLKPILCEFEPKPVSLYAIYPSQRHLPQRVRTLIDFLAERFCENPYWDIFTTPSPAA